VKNLRYKDKIYSFNQTPQNEGLPLPPEQEVGYLSVSVFTASGALPVQGALVTVYIIDESGVENEIVHHVTDANGKEPNYARIYEGQWLNDEPYGVVHRVASKTGKRGVASFCLNWCFEQCRNLRIDTHRDNIPMHNLLIMLGFVPCGIIYLENGDERIGYQKTEGE
jgi:hypothetical protein